MRTSQVVLIVAVVAAIAFAATSSSAASKPKSKTIKPQNLDGIPLDGRRLSDAEVAYLCAWAGWEGQALEDAVRIVLGESGGNPQAVNVNKDAKGIYKDSVDRGLWQFNNVAFPDVTPDIAQDVELSTKRAYKVWQKVGFKPWRAGATETHTRHKVKGAWVADTALINRARKAVATLAA